jgi:RNA polymerase sigma factor (sigma-70 family)
MTPNPVRPLLSHIRSLAGAPTGPEASDRELLHRFATGGDEAAFEILVRRHGPMVLRLGRRLLPGAADAEDVFQATFLLLARKASSVRWYDSIAQWLYGVAYHLAQKSKRAAARRSAHERRAGVRCPHDPLAELTGRELLAILDEEMQRLPDRYREPLVLCYLEGLTRDEAAQRLGCPLGTLKSRLERGKDLLGRALTRRGVGLGAALAASLALAGRGSGAVPPALVQSALDGVRGAAAVSPGVRTLLGSATPSVLVTRLSVVAVLMTVGLAAAGFALAMRQQTPAAAPAESPAAASIPRAADTLGDPLPDGVLLRLGSLRFRHRGTLRSLAFSPDGKLLVSGGWDRVLRLWDPATGCEVRQIDGPKDGVEAIAFSPDGKVLAGAGDSCAYLWDAETGREIRRLQGHKGRVTALAFSPGGKLLATADEGTIRLWEMPGGPAPRVFTIGAGSIYAVAFSPDGRALAAAGADRTVGVWAVEGGKVLHYLRGHNVEITGIAFSPDSQTLISVGCDAIRFWDVKSGESVSHPAGKVRNGTAAAFSPNGKLLALGSDQGVIQLWDWVAGEPLWQVDAHPARVQTLAFSPDGKTLASGSAEESIQLWNVATGRSLDPTPGHSQRVCAAAYSADGRVIATAAWDGTVRLWDARTGHVLRCFNAVDAGTRAAFPLNPRQLAGLALSPDGRLIAAAGYDEVLRVWDAASGQEVHRFQGRCVAFAPDGKLIAVGGRGTDGAEVNMGVIRLYDASTGKEVRALRGHLTTLAHVAFSADGRTLVSTGQVLFGARFGDPGESETRFVRFWDVATGRELHDGPAGARPGCMTLSPDGHTLAGTADAGRTIHLWETATMQQRTQLAGHQGTLLAIAFAPDSRTLASGSMDGTIRLWDLPSGKEIARLAGHRGWVLSLAFAPDGRTLVSAGLDTTALVWDLGRYLRRPMAAADWKAEELEAQWKALAGDAAPAYAASARLVAAPRRAVALLRERVRPVTRPDQRQLARLVADLDSDNFDRREQATAALEAIGELAGPALRQALKGAAPEARRRLQALVASLDEGRLTAEQVRGLRCVEILERIGDNEARRVLQALAGGMPEARLTREAKRALDRLAARPN